MLLYQNERTAIFIDGANFYHAMRLLGWEIDYLSLKLYFSKQCHLLRAYYYTALIENSATHDAVRGLTHFLAHNGYTVITKPLKQQTNYTTGDVTRKGNMDVEIAVGMLTMAQSLDHLVLVSGDGDFRCLVQAVQEMGKRVTVLATRVPAEKITADELVRQADNFIDIEELKKYVARDGATRTKAALAATKSVAPAASS